jgi:hypothetical protein
MRIVSLNALVRIAVVALALIVIVLLANSRNNMPGITDLWTNVKESISDFFKPDPNKVFAEQWSENYHGKVDVKKKERAYEVITSDYEVPKDAMKGILDAAYVFEGDGGFDKSSIIDGLSKIGAIESNYTTKVQKDEGPARSYWQVEPHTAKDLLENSSALFGDKFNETFAQYGEGDETAYEVLADKSPKELSVLLESDTSLGAAFATAKMITTFN